VTTPASPTTHEAIDPGAPLLTFLRGVLGADTRYIEPPTSFGSGFDTMIYGFQVAGSGARGPWGEPLVLRVYRSAEQDARARAEAAIQRFAHGHRYPAVPPLAVETSDGMLGLPFMIVERLPGGTMLERFTRRPWKGPALFGELGRLHARLHALPLEGAPITYARSSIDRFLDDLRMVVAEERLDGVEQDVAWIEGHAGDVRDEEPALVHGDFHPLNVVYAGDGTPRVIDWSDATVGDRHADVARTTTLVWFAQIAASSTLERLALKAVRGPLRRWYLAGYERARPLDRRRLTFWEAAQALRGTVQLMAVHAGADGRLAERLPEGLIAEARAHFRAKAEEYEGGGS
jgi:aminoglycoside phosphotransferase (APT) family kinase protein